MSEWRRWLVGFVALAAAYGAGLFTVWLVAGGAKEAPDGFNVAGFFVSLLATIIAWRIFEIQHSNQTKFEKSQTELLTNVQNVLTEIREITRSTQGQIEQQRAAVEELRRESGRETKAVFEVATSTISRAQDELAEVAKEVDPTETQRRIRRLEEELSRAKDELRHALARADAATRAWIEAEAKARPMTFQALSDRLARLPVSSGPPTDVPPANG